MKQKYPYGIVLFLFLMTASIAWSDGTFMVVKGQVFLESQGKKVPARIGMKVHAKDKVIAGKNARAKIVMVDKNVLNISPDTTLLIETYKTGAADKSVSLNVLYGKVRATVNQKYDGDKHKFQVKTPSAVAGVRGTDFLTQYSPSNNTSRVVTFEGQVQVGSGLDASGRISNPVMVNPGQFTVASAGVAPAPPATVPPRELMAISQDSKADPNGPSDRQPANEPSPGDNKKDSKKNSDKKESNQSQKEKQSSSKEPSKNGDAKKPTANKDNKANNTQKTDPKNSSQSTNAKGPTSNSKAAPSTTAGANTGQKGPSGTGGPLNPAGPGLDRGPAATPPPPSMMLDMSKEMPTEIPNFNMDPASPPPIIEVYKPPEIPQDLLNQTTNLKININVQ